MKNLIISLLFGLIQFSGFSRPCRDTIKISKDIQLIKISDDAYIHVSYSYVPGYGRVGANGLILINKNEAFLFDTPWTDSLTGILYHWITDSMKLKVAGFIPNHWHSDCMGGLGFLQKQGVDSYANQMTIDIARSKGLPLPEHGFNDSLKIRFGDILIYCYYLGAAHSLDNIAVWIPSEKILFAGCMVKSMDSGNLGNTADGDLKAYPKTLARLAALFPSAEIVIPGHGKYGGMELIRHTIALASN